VIDEKNFRWIHVSFSKKPRKQILHLWVKELPLGELHMKW
jgi:hypothetical protein